MPTQHQVVPDEQFEVLKMDNKRPKQSLEKPQLVFPEEQVPQEQEFVHEREEEEEDNLEGVFVHEHPEAKQGPQDEERNLDGIIPVVNPTRSAPSVPPRNLVDSVDNVEGSNAPSTMKPTSAEGTQQPKKRKADRKFLLLFVKNVLC